MRFDWLAVRIVVWGVLALAAYWGIYLATLDRSPPESVRVGFVEPKAAAPGQKASVWAHVWVDLSRKCDASSMSWVVDSKGEAIEAGRDDISGYARSELFRRGFDGPLVPFDFLVPIRSAPGPAEFLRRTEFACHGYPSRVVLRNEWRAPFTILESEQ